MGNTAQQIDSNGRTALSGLTPGSGFATPQLGNQATDSVTNLLYAPTIVAPVDGQKASYSAVKVGLVPPASTPDDVFTITGSATKTIRVTRVEIYGTQATGGGTNDVQLVVRSTANSGGTSTASTAVPHDSTSAAATATVLSYTANATLGNAVGTIRTAKMFLNVAATGQSDRVIWDFGNRPSQGVVLRGTSQVLAVNLNHVAITNAASLDLMIEWTEE